MARSIAPFALLFAAAALAGCPGPEVVPTDTGGTGIDARPVDAPALADAGPACSGTPTACAGRAATACTLGCRDGICGGSPSPCGLLPDTFCENAGCELSAGTCTGTPAFCSFWTSEGEDDCDTAGCDWTAGCMGTPRTCESLTAAECATVPGCGAVAPLDGGTMTDAPGTDAPVVMTDAPVTPTDAPSSCLTGYPTLDTAAFISGLARDRKSVV